MSERNLTVRFINPAFLGNAAQEGQWRSPPFKALIRQWWRIVQSREVQYKPDALREEEGILFGHAGSNGAKKSQLLIRMGHWRLGSLNEWVYSRNLRFQHPEVRRPVSADLYLGYGPIHPPNTRMGRPSAGLEHPPAIKPSESNQVKLKFPTNPSVDRAIQLIQWFGTMGGRSRNGWGSLDISDEHIEPFGAAHPLLNLVSRDWHQCLDHEWPHAIGKDDRGLLIWHTDVMDSWEKVMQELARVKVSFRRKFPFETKEDSAKAEDRHVLAYPVTKHEPSEWKNKRNANSIRFKVIKSDEGYQGRIFHLPCGLPQPFSLNFPRSRQESVWEAVHQNLDRDKRLQRCQAGAS